jgi:hypothetical protein
MSLEVLAVLAPIFAVAAVALTVLVELRLDERADRPRRAIDPRSK